MLDIMSRNWWMMLIRGLGAIVFGVLVILLPDLALPALILLFAAYVAVDGIFSLAQAWAARSVHDRWWVNLIEGIAGLAAAVIAVLWPGLTALALLYLIAAWAVITGVFEIAAAFELRKQITNEIWLGISGILSVVFGGLLFAFPGSGALAVLWIIGAYSFVFGIMLCVLAFHLREFRHEDEQTIRQSTSTYVTN